MTEPQPVPRPTPTIRGELVYLRPAEREDLPRFVRWFADEETTRYLTVRAPFSQAEEEQWFAGMVGRQGKTDYHFVICRLADDEPIGTAGLHDLDFVNGNAEFGISIGEKASGTRATAPMPCARSATSASASCAWSGSSSRCTSGNARARRSYEKAGFVLEGTLRQRHFAEGRHSDVLIMALLREEWAAQDRRRSWELNELG